MTDFTNLRNACRAASEALTAAQAAERDARRELHRASDEFSKAAMEAVKPHFVKDQVLTFGGKEVQIVSYRTHIWEPGKVLAVFAVRTKAGPFGKTVTTSNIVWDFDANCWKEG